MKADLVVHADRAGVLRFDDSVPEGCLEVARSGRHRKLRGVISAIARHAYDSETLLVPGVPEAESDAAALDALIVFRDAVEMRL